MDSPHLVIAEVPMFERSMSPGVKRRSVNNKNKIRLSCGGAGPLIPRSKTPNVDSSRTERKDGVQWAVLAKDFDVVDKSTTTAVLEIEGGQEGTYGRKEFCWADAKISRRMFHIECNDAGTLRVTWVGNLQPFYKNRVDNMKDYKKMEKDVPIQAGDLTSIILSKRYRLIFRLYSEWMQNSGGKRSSSAQPVRITNRSPPPAGLKPALRMSPGPQRQEQKRFSSPKRSSSPRTPPENSRVGGDAAASASPVSPRSALSPPDSCSPQSNAKSPSRSPDTTTKTKRLRNVSGMKPIRGKIEDQHEISSSETGAPSGRTTASPMKKIVKIKVHDNKLTKTLGISPRTVALPLEPDMNVPEVEELFLQKLVRGFSEKEASEIRTALQNYTLVTGHPNIRLSLMCGKEKDIWDIWDPTMNVVFMDLQQSSTGHRPLSPLQTREHPLRCCTPEAHMKRVLRVYFEETPETQKLFLAKSFKAVTVDEGMSLDSVRANLISKILRGVQHSQSRVSVEQDLEQFEFFVVSRSAATLVRLRPRLRTNPGGVQPGRYLSEMD